MVSRRKFIRQSAIGGLALSIGNWSNLFSMENNAGFSYQSDFIKLQLAKDQPALNFFSTDSLGGGNFDTNPLFPPTAGKQRYYSRSTRNAIRYYADESFKSAPVWDIKCSAKKIKIRTRFEEGKGEPLILVFSQKANHCTALGTLAGDKQLKFPCLLHFPGMGSFRVYCNQPDVTIFYDAELTKQPYIKLAFQEASASHPDITYTLESVAIFPESPKIKQDPRYDGFKKNYINIFQINPRFKTLANNSTSDICAFTVCLYAEMARKTPRLVEGLSAMDLVRNTLDQYLNGLIGYGMVGKPNWKGLYNSSDSFPSLIMAACYYILDTRDMGWAKVNYAGICKWAEQMLATDKNNDGLIEYGYSGNAGSWNTKDFKRPSNWWDTIGFGHDDAYSNALAYRALILLTEVSGLVANNEGKTHFSAAAARLKSNYFKTFYNPETGVLAGWRSEDGKLHDYYFTFVNSIAVHYGLLNEQQGKAVMSKLLVKMKEVGFTNFGLGLPGNLIPVRDEDYAHKSRRWGWGKDPEGRDGFQIYENGGATGCYVYFTIKALNKSGMKKEADMILMPLLDTFKNGGLEGTCPGGTMTKDWKTWSGECWGYEGFLVDNYLVFLAVTEDYLS